MPQPLRNIANLSISPEAMDERPALAARVATIAAISTLIEARLGVLLAHITGADAGTACRIYVALASASPRNEVLRTAAQAHLPEELQKELESLLKRIRERAEERNDIVHGLWGFSPDHPDALILCDPGELVLWIGDTTTLQAESTRPAPLKAKKWRPMIYKEHDFRQTEGRLWQLEEEVRKFTRKVAASLPTATPR